MLTISVITPSYNQGKFIERTIRSVLSQKIPNQMEYFIIDGGSSDNTIEILNKYNDKLNWVSEPDKGQTHAVNKGIEKSKGDIIAWLNSDDIYYPGTFKKILQIFENCPNIDVIYGNAFHIGEKDEELELYYTEIWNPLRLREVCYLSQPAVFFRRELIDKFGKLDESLQYCMDYEFWLRLNNLGAKFYYYPKVLAGSRLYQDTKTLGARVKVHKEINDMLKKTIGFVPDRWLSNYAHVVMEDQNITPNKHRKKLALKIVLASLRWNKYISRSLMHTIFSWFKKKGIVK